MTQPTAQIDIFTLLFKSAQQGHGRTLQPSQVNEVVETMMGLDHQGRQLAGKVEALTRIVFAMLHERDAVLLEDGKLVTPPFKMSAELYESLDYEKGFTLDWDEDTGIITVAIAEEPAVSGGDSVGVPEVPEDDVAAEVSESHLASVPEPAEDTEDLGDPHADVASDDVDDEGLGDSEGAE